MIYATGTELTLLDVANRFIEFCQTTNASTDAWELIDNNVDSFFGTTFRIKGLDADSYGYISFNHIHIVKGTTYSEWYNSSLHYLSEDYVHSGLLSDGSTASITSMDGNEEIFNESGFILSFNVHKQYCDGLYSCEQGGAYSPQGSDMNLQVFRYKNTPSTGRPSESFFIPPLYPNSGSPKLCISESNLDNTYGIKYYFTRENRCATIVINIGDKWQTISFGLMSGVDTDTYKFPAYICGGSSGARPSISRYTPINTSLTLYKTGNKISLDIGYPGLSNGNMTSPCKVNGGIVNFVVMSPDGVWEECYNMAQTATVMSYHVCSGPVTQWGYPLDSPTLDNTVHNSVFPADTCMDNFVATENIGTANSGTDSCYFLPVIPYRRTSASSGLSGFINNMFVIISDKLSTGVAIIDSKNYLIIPNGWNNRQVYYQYNVGVYTDWITENLASTFDSTLHRKLCTLAIKLED